MTLRPRVPTDLALAPVAAGIDLNLQRLRDKAQHELVAEIGLELNDWVPGATREERAQQVLTVALRDVDLHGWAAEISEDGSRVHLSGGSVSLDIGLSAEILRYIEAPEHVA